MGGEECREGQNRALGIELGHRVKTLLPGNLWSREGVKALNADAKKSSREGKLRVTGRVESSVKSGMLQTRREDGGAGWGGGAVSLWRLGDRTLTVVQLDHSGFSTSR